jgi:hypothetical protein
MYKNKVSFSFSALINIGAKNLILMKCVHKLLPTEAHSTPHNTACVDDKNAKS